MHLECLDPICCFSGFIPQFSDLTQAAARGHIYFTF